MSARTVTGALEEAEREKEAALYRPAAHNLSAALREHRYVEIYAFPALDAVLAASILMDSVITSDADAKTIIAAELPSEMSEPSVLLGYPSWIVEETRFPLPSLLITNTQRPQGKLLPIPIVSRQDSSITAMTVHVLQELGVITGKEYLAVIAGHWRGFDMGKRAEFVGAEKGIVGMLRYEGRLGETLTLRVYRWHREPLARSIYITVDPFLPGLTGDRGAVERFFEEDPRIKGIRGTSAREAPQDSLAVLAEKLYNLLREESRVMVKPSELIGYAYYFEGFPLEDPREAGMILAYYSCIAGYSSLVGLASNPEPVTGVAHYHYYARGFPRLVEAIEELRGVKELAKRTVAGARVVEVDSEPCSLVVIEKSGRKLGYVPGDAVALAGDRVLVEKSVEIYGYKWFYNGLREKCIDYLPGTPLAVLRKTC